MKKNIWQEYIWIVGWLLKKGASTSYKNVALKITNIKEATIEVLTGEKESHLKPYEDIKDYDAMGEMGNNGTRVAFVMSAVIAWLAACGLKSCEEHKKDMPVKNQTNTGPIEEVKK